MCATYEIHDVVHFYPQLALARVLLCYLTPTTDPSPGFRRHNKQLHPWLAKGPNQSLSPISISSQLARNFEMAKTLVLAILAAGIGIAVASKSCSDVEGYEFFEGVDSQGFDIVPHRNLRQEYDLISVEEFASYCNTLEYCMGFNSNGWMKYKLVDPSSRRKVPDHEWGDVFGFKGLYVKIRSVAVNYDFSQGQDSFDPRYDIRKEADKSIEELASACDADKTCYGFNSNGVLKKAILASDQRFRIPTDWWAAGGTEKEGLYTKKRKFNWCDADKCITDGGGEKCDRIVPEGQSEAQLYCTWATWV